MADSSVLSRTEEVNKHLALVLLVPPLLVFRGPWGGKGPTIFLPLSTPLVSVLKGAVSQMAFTLTSP